MSKRLLFSFLIVASLSFNGRNLAQQAPRGQSSVAANSEVGSDAKGRLKEARRQIKRNPTSGYWHNQAGLLLIQLKKPVEGHKELKLATEYEPNVSFYHACLGTFLYRDGDLAGAERSWRKALTIDPKNPVLLFELGRVLQDQGRIDAAVKQYHDSLFALEKASLDPTGKNYIDPNGSYFSIDRLRDAVTGRLREIEEARKK